MNDTMTVYSGFKRVVPMLYPVEKCSGKTSYGVSFVLFITLFVVATLKAFTTVGLPWEMDSSAGWICLGLSTASFGALMVGGTWRHGFDISKYQDAKKGNENQLDLTKSYFGVNIGKWHVGRGREILHTIPLFIISLVGALGGCDVSTMAQGIFITQIVSAGLYYGVFAAAIPIGTKKLINYFAKIQEPDSHLTKLVRQGYPLNNSCQKMNYYLASAMMITMLVLLCLNASGHNIPGVGWIATGLSLGSLVMLCTTGLHRHKATWREGNQWRLGLWKESLQTLIIGTICVLGMMKILSPEWMALGVGATQITSTGMYGLIAHQFNKRQEARLLESSTKTAAAVAASGGGADAPYMAFGDDDPPSASTATIVVIDDEAEKPAKPKPVVNGNDPMKQPLLAEASEQPLTSPVNDSAPAVTAVEVNVQADVAASTEVPPQSNDEEGAIL